MKKLTVLLLVLLSGNSLMAQEENSYFKSPGVFFTGDEIIHTDDKHLVGFTGNVHFSASIVEIEKADKIVYDKSTKTFTISGFSELFLNGKKKLASDLGLTTLKLEVGDWVAYLVADIEGCAGGKGKGC